MAQVQRRALDRLSAVREIEGFYLAGGAAIGVYLEHRRSEDLDLFSVEPGGSLEPFRAFARQRGSGIVVIDASDITVKFDIGGARVDLVSYPYPPVDPLTSGPSGIKLAAPLDLFAMKLAAVAGRGLRRDFWDIEALLRSGVTMLDGASTYLRRFGLSEPDLYHVGRALTYFADAEKDPAYPMGLTPQKWAAIKRYVQRRAPELLDIASGAS